MPAAFALLLGLSGCVVHVHEKAEAGSSTQSSGGETASNTKPATQPVGTDKPRPATPAPDDARDRLADTPRDKPAADKPADKPSTGSDKPAAGQDSKPIDRIPVASDKLTGVKPGSTAKPTDKPADKPTDKPADKPADKPQTDKPIATLPVATDKLTGVKPGSTAKPTPDKPADKPADKPEVKEPQGPPDKPGLAVDKPVTFTDRDRTKLGQTQRVETAADKVKPTGKQGVAGKLTGASGVAGSRVAMDSAPCQLYSRNVEAGGKLRLKVLDARSDAQVLLEDKPLEVTKRDPKAWVVTLAEDAKSGRVTLKDGDKSVACGRIEVR